jgi:hypothetical protein
MSRFAKIFRATWSLWLLVLSLLPIATTFAPLVSFAYDGQNQTTVAYDRVGEPAVGYDAASALARNEKKAETIGNCVPFAKFVGFLAPRGAADRISNRANPAN